MKIAITVAVFVAIMGMASAVPCGPPTKIHLPIGENAVGDPVWSAPFPGQKPTPIGRYDVEIAKVCGPGKFTFSPTSCGRMDYSPDIFEFSKDSVTTECSVVQLDYCKTAGLGCMLV